MDQYVKTSNCHYILLGGRIVFNIQDPKNLWEVYDSISSLQNKTNANNNKSVTANLVCSIDVFRTVGEFNENTSGGDFEWTKRTLDFGFKLKYNDNITIYHPTRKTFREIKRKYYRFGLGWGEEIAESKKNLQLSKFYYFLRIFYFPTNIRYSAILFTKLGLVKTILLTSTFFSSDIIFLEELRKDCKEEIMFLLISLKTRQNENPALSSLYPGPEIRKDFTPLYMILRKMDTK